MSYRMLMIGAALMMGSAGASAQYPGGGYPNHWDGAAFWRGAPDSPRERIGFLQARIDRGIANGSLNPAEARSASHALDNIRRMDMRLHYDDGGRLSPDDHAMIEGRLDALSRRIHWLRHDGW